MAKEPIKSIRALVFLFLLMVKTASAQILGGITCNIFVLGISAKLYNFIFASSDNRRSVLMPIGVLPNFAWNEYVKGIWSIRIIPVPSNIKKAIL